MTEKKKEKRKCVCHTSWNLNAISFHSVVKGRLITLSENGRRVTRDGSSFCHGLTFSGRQVMIEEKVCLRVEQCVGRWHGALRVGFAHVLPDQTTLPPLAIPDLTNSPLYAAVVVPDDMCRPGSEVQFWLKKNGSLRVRSSDGRTQSETTALNVKWPIWALIDVYGQTTAVTMLGSKKKSWIFTRRSCPTLTHIKYIEDYVHLDIREHEAPEYKECVVCYSDVANSRLSCGHKCVCTPCAMMVCMIFGTCPLCRKALGSFHPYDN